jgi:hypothetical protein
LYEVSVLVESFFEDANTNTVKSKQIISV